MCRAYEGRRRILWSVLLCTFIILLSLGAMAQARPSQLSYTLTTITLRDVTASANISEYPVMFFAHNLNTNENERITDFIGKDSKFTYRLSPGNWVIEFRIFDASSRRFEYYSKNVINVQQTDERLNKTFYLTPVGSIGGQVLGPDGEPIIGAALDFVCASNLRYDELPTTTNSVGAFHADIIPIGSCKVYSTRDDMIGSATVDVMRGQRTEMTIILEARKVGVLGIVVWIFGILLVLLVGLLVTIFILKRGVKKEVDEQFRHREKNGDGNGGNGGKAEEHPLSSVATAATPITTAPAEGSSRASIEDVKQTSENHNPRARDILKTLNEREVTITTFLLDSDHEATQAKIRNSLGIPKTSLSRAFTSLEQKKIISIARIGNMKRVKLTNWFLGRE